MRSVGLLRGIVGKGLCQSIGVSVGNAVARRMMREGQLANRGYQRAVSLIARRIPRCTRYAGPVSAVISGRDGIVVDGSGLSSASEQT
jgi:hypothetical protein